MKGRLNVAGLPAEDLKMTTRRLVMRPYTLADHDCWKSGYQNRSLKRNRFDAGRVEADAISKAAFRKVVRFHQRAREKDKLYVLGLFERTTGRHVGYVDIYVHSRLDFQTANLGYALHNQHWGQGFAKEAAKAAIDFAFRKLKLHRLEAGIEKGNHASVAVAKAIGMRFEGTRKKIAFDDGVWKDLDYFSITAEKIGIRKMKPTVVTRFAELLAQ